jgi:hypothetical protein
MRRSGLVTRARMSLSENRASACMLPLSRCCFAKSLLDATLALVWRPPNRRKLKMENIPEIAC